MALSNTGSRAADTPLTQGLDHALLEQDGPTAHGDRMGTPAPDETVLWKGRPDLLLLARTAFHTRSLGLYFGALILVALATGNHDAAMVAAVLGVALLALLYLLAWLSARSTLYILTDVRLIMRIGIAIETRVNIPLKQVKAAQFRPRAKDHGDIALELSGERLLGYLLLWPHARPLRLAHPQPMLRAIPEAAKVAQLMAEVRARYGVIDRSSSETRSAAGAPETAKPAAPRRANVALSDTGLEGAPA